MNTCGCGAPATLMIKHECAERKQWRCTGYRATCDMHAVEGVVADLAHGSGDYVQVRLDRARGQRG